VSAQIGNRLQYLIYLNRVTLAMQANLTAIHFGGIVNRLEPVVAVAQQF
jgi:hypothetical protein